MKLDKNSYQVITLFITALALICTIFTTVFNKDIFLNDNEIILVMGIILVGIITSVYTLLIIKRINPKIKIYFSYSQENKEIVNKVCNILNEQLDKSARYRFEILNEDSIDFGDNVQKTLERFISESSVIIVFISNEYLSSKWCIKEYNMLQNTNKTIIPILLQSYSELKDMPRNIHDIKSLELYNCNDSELIHKVEILGKNIVRRREIRK